MPALASFMIGIDGSISDETVEHYRRRAAGGPALVIMEACAVSPEGVVSSHQAVIHDDRFIDGLSKIARAMKAEGGGIEVRNQEELIEQAQRLLRDRSYYARRSQAAIRVIQNNRGATQNTLQIFEKYLGADSLSPEVSSTA